MFANKLPLSTSSIQKVYTEIGYQSNAFTISGVVREMNLPLPCRVRVYEKLTGRLISEVLTNDRGLYSFKDLMKVPYFIVAHHPASLFNAVIQDNVVPK